MRRRTADSGRVAIQLSQALMRDLGNLRYEPTQKRVRARAGGRTVVDSRRAALVWEPSRIVPSYAVPGADIAAELVASASADADPHPVAIARDGPPVLDPRTAFAVHTCPGQTLSLRAGELVLGGAGFRPAELDSLVVLDFAAFDEWLEEDEPSIGHPRDPYHRIDVLRTSRRVRIEVDGVAVADSTSARLLFETMLGPRFYLPRQDVRMDLLTPSPTTTTCAYKGHASYWSVAVGATVHPDLVWTYDHPLADATRVAGLLCFFDEHVDVILDGERRERPVTPWS